MRGAYSALFTLLLPLILLRLLVKSRRLPAYRHRILERLARYPARSSRSDRPIWIHAVSVGECEAAFPLVKALLKNPRTSDVVMTCTTPTGSSRIEAVLGDLVQHVYLPYDLPAFADRFFSHFKPRLAIIMETELWPNLFSVARARSVPVLIANGRLSERSVRGYRKVSALIQPALDAITRVIAQSPEDAARYLDLGIDPDAVVVGGNLKYDLMLSEDIIRESQVLRKTLFGQRPVVIAGSTHPGEEEQVLEAFGLLRNQFENAILVLAPRHPERSLSVLSLVRSMGFSVLLRSSQRAPEQQHSVFLIDGVGELKRFYGASDIAFVGGSLIPHGGQNPLEPLAFGVPVVFGPSMDNFKEAREKILRASAGRQVSDAESLFSTWTELLHASDRARSMGRAGLQMIDENRGALQYTCRELNQLLSVPSVSSSLREHV